MPRVQNTGMKHLSGPKETSEAKPEMQKVERTKWMLPIRARDPWQMVEPTLTNLSLLTEQLINQGNI